MTVRRCPSCGQRLPRDEPPHEPGLFGDLKKMAMRDQPITSWEAALRALRDRSHTQVKVAIVLRDLGPLTDLEIHHQCCARFGHRAESSYRKRRTELTELGLVFDTQQRKVEDGERRVLWALSADGQQVFASAQE
jgi:hypothetical protein